MALMVCPDCGNNISDTAEQCIHCGCDLFLFKEELRIDKEIEERVKAFEGGIKKPKQISSLSEIPQYRNEENANTLMLSIAVVLLVVGFFGLMLEWELFLCVIFFIGGVAALLAYIYLRKNTEKLLKEEQAKIQNVIDNFDKVKELRVKRYREMLIAEKPAKLEKIRTRYVPTTTQRPVGIRCPACDSTQFEKISTLNRVVSVELAGLASSKIGKQYKCKKCGHLW